MTSFPTKPSLAAWTVKSADGGDPSPSGRWLFFRQEAFRYGIAPIAVALAFAARVALTPLLPDDAPYLLFVPAVLVAAAFGGLGPGLLATALGALLGLLFIATAPPRRARNRQRGCVHGHRRRHRVERGAAATLPQAGGRKRARRARARGSSAVDSRHRAGCDDRHRRARDHAIVQLGRRAPVRLRRGGGAGKKHQDADAVAVPGESRRLPRAISPHRRAANHRHRPGRRRRAQGRLDLSDGAGRRRDAVEQSALLHRLHPRPDRAPADRGEAAGVAVRARAYFPIDRHGRDGVRARP